MKVFLCSKILLLIFGYDFVCQSYAYTTKVRLIVLARGNAPLHASNSLSEPRRVALARGLRLNSILAFGWTPWSATSSVRAEDQELPPNPLNLKGQYWQTGKVVYRQGLSTDDLSADPSVLLGELLDAREALASLNAVVNEGNLKQVEAALHGGVVSEKNLALRARALTEFIDDEDKESLAQKAFERFIRRYDDLDETVGLALKKVPSSELEASLETIGLAVISPLSAINEAGRAKSPQTQVFSGYTQLEISKGLGKAIRELDTFCMIASEGIPSLSAKVKKL